MYVIGHSDAHRHWQDDLRVSCKVSNVAVQRDPFLCCSSFADSKGDSKDCICSKFCCLKKLRSSKTYIISKSGVSIENPHRYKNLKTPHIERPDAESIFRTLTTGWLCRLLHHHVSFQRSDTSSVNTSISILMVISYFNCQQNNLFSHPWLSNQNQITISTIG